MDTQIILRYSGLEFDLHLGDGVELNFTYQAGDIRKVLSRNTSFSKTITLPGDAYNNQVFSNIYDVTADSKFNPNKKADVVVSSKGNVLFIGYLKLDSIKNTDGNVTYECTLTSAASNLFSDLGAKTMCELNFTRFTHDFTFENVSNSWSSTIKINGQDIPVQAGLGYTYPWVDFGINEIVKGQVRTDFFRPALYAKTVWDQIFLEAGYDYDSEFINSEYFKYIIATRPGKTDKYDTTLLYNTKALAGMLDTNTIPGHDASEYGELIVTDTTHIHWTSRISRGKRMGMVVLNNDYTNGMYDNGNNFNPNILPDRYSYTVDTPGEYAITARTFTNLTVHFDYLTPGDEPTDELQVKGGFNYYTQVCINRNGVIIEPAQLSYTLHIDADRTNGGGLINKDNEFINQTNVELIVDNKIFLQRGDIVFVKTGYDCDDVQQWRQHPLLHRLNYDITNDLYELQPTVFAIELRDSQLGEGAEQDFTCFYGDEKQKDFILSIAKIFNLYFYIDNHNPRLLHIEPRTKFYNYNSVLEWDYKLNKNFEVQLTPTTDLQSAQLLLTYSSDNDYWNSKYSNEFKDEVYSQYKYLNDDNEWVDVDSVEKIDVIFAASPPSQKQFTPSSALTETAIYDFDPTDGKSFAKDSKIRLLFYKGLINIPYTFYVFENYIDSFNIGTSHQIQAIPWAGMIDNPYAQTDSLEFSFPKAYYYPRTEITTSNIFTKFWEKFLIESFDKNAKILTAYFHLTASDISNLNFKDIIYLLGRYWVINIITDYNPVENNLTKVELLMLNDYDNVIANINAYQQTKIPSTGEFDVNSRGVGAYKTDNSTQLFNYNLKLGYDNSLNLHSQSSGVLGNYNQLGESTSAFVLGNQNRLVGGTNSVMLIGDNIYAETYLNNAMVVGQAISGQTFVSNGINTNKINLIPDLSGNQGTIMINGIPIVTGTITAQTVGNSTYDFSGFTSVNGIDKFVNIIEATVVGYNYTNYKAYAAKLTGSFKISGTSLIQQVNEPDLFEKSDFGGSAISNLFTDGDAIYLSVNGDVGETINWTVRYNETII